MKILILRLLKFYKKNISFLYYGSCKFHPSCCDYFMQSVEKFGALKGSFYGFLRLLRCNPFSKGGFDPVK